MGVTILRLWHGGVPGLRPGDLLIPGQERRHHDGCPYCEARQAQAAGSDMPTLDPLSHRPDRVYLTSVREYARFYASLYGRGDLYRVEPLDSAEIEPSAEDHFPAWTAPAARVLAVYDRAVLLTWAQRRRLLRDWTEADARALAEVC